MKNFSLLFLTFVCLSSEVLSQTPKTKAEIRKAQALYEWQRTHDPETGKIPVEQKLLAAEEREQAIKATAQNPAAKTLLMAQPRWIEIGPSNIAGRIRSFLLSPSNQIAQAGGVSGGLWYGYNISDANTNTWLKYNDWADNLCVTTIARNPANSNILYYGTGEGYYNGNDFVGELIPQVGATQWGGGIWKTLDAGLTWQRLAATYQAAPYTQMAKEEFRLINKIVVANNGHIFVSTIGTTANPGGVFLSKDGGATFTRFLGNGTIATQKYGGDIELAANGTIYISMGLYTEDLAVYKCIYNSTTTNWSATAINTGLPINQGIKSRRVELACAPTNSTTLYAFLASASQSIGGTDFAKVYKSINGGTSWTACGTLPSAILNDQMSYNMTIKVSPVDANKVVIGGDVLAYSTNAGTNWTAVTTNPHGDIHELVFNNTGNGLYVASDGGIHYHSNIFGANIVTARNKDLNITQFYSCAVSAPAYSTTYIGGTQDNGVLKFTGADSYMPCTSIMGGDGGICHINPNNANQKVISGYFCNYLYDNGSGGFPVTFADTQEGFFINPTEMDWTNGILISAYNEDEIAFYAGVTSATGIITPTVHSFTAGTGMITFIKKSPTLANVVYIGTDKGNVYKITYTPSNLATALTVDYLNTTVLPIGFISSIDIKGTNDAEILVSFSNYNASTSSTVKNIWYTSTANLGSGASWKALDDGTNLPNIPVWSVLFAPTNSQSITVLVGTELGCYYTTDALSGTSFVWGVDANSPNTRVSQLVYRPSDKMVFMATFGRGLWRSDVFCDAHVWFDCAQTSFGNACPITFASQSTGLAPTNVNAWKVNDVSVSAGADNNLTICSATNLTWVKLTTKVTTPGGGGTSNVSIVQRAGYLSQYIPSMSCPPNLCGMQNQRDINKGVEDVFQIFPNPTENYIIEISCNDKSLLTNALLEICDLEGSVFYEKRMDNNTIEIILPQNMAKGIYIVRLKTLDNTFYKKLIIN